MKNMIKDAAVLLIITLFSGLILGVVFQVTKAPIAKSEEEAAKKAYAEVFPVASEFELMADTDTEGSDGTHSGLRPGFQVFPWKMCWRPLIKTAQGWVMFLPLPAMRATAEISPLPWESETTAL